jgi:hypothetical protein
MSCFLWRVCRRGERTFGNVVDVKGEKLLLNVAFKKQKTSLRFARSQCGVSKRQRRGQCGCVDAFCMLPETSSM